MNNLKWCECTAFSITHRHASFNGPVKKFKQKGDGMNKLRFFEKELADLGFSEDHKTLIRTQMVDGLEIMTKREITETLEEYKNLVGIGA